MCKIMFKLKVKARTGTGHKIIGVKKIKKVQKKLALYRVTLYNISVIRKGLNKALINLVLL